MQKFSFAVSNLHYNNALLDDLYLVEIKEIQTEVSFKVQNYEYM